MKITLRPVNAANRAEIAALSVRPDQQHLVTNAPESIAEAEAYLADGGWACAMGIYDGDTPVGFAMVGYDAVPHGPDGPVNMGPPVYEIVRFFIDQRYQGRGYGRAAMPVLLDYLRTRPGGRADWCWISYKPENLPAEKLYCSCGFQKTNLTNYDETVAVQRL